MAPMIWSSEKHMLEPLIKRQQNGYIASICDTKKNKTLLDGGEPSKFRKGAIYKLVEKIDK
jgi:hypothetical protein